MSEQPNNQQPAAAPIDERSREFAAVDMFAATMKAKLDDARAKGRSGWEQCDQADLSRMLREHVEKGDPRDVANFCMFLWALGKPITAPSPADERAAFEAWLKQPPAQADAREGLTDLLSAHVLDCSGGGCANAELIHDLRALLAAHPGQPEPRIERLRKALFESRDAMRVMSNWVKKSDPAGHAWGLHMVDRANAALNGEPEPRAEVTHGDTTMDECMASLLDRMEAAELDADRYRYLRARPLNAVSVGGVFAGKTPDNVVLNGADLDAAVDAARTEASS